MKNLPIPSLPGFLAGTGVFRIVGGIFLFFGLITLISATSAAYKAHRFDQDGITTEGTIVSIRESRRTETKNGRSFSYIERVPAISFRSDDGRKFTFIAEASDSAGYRTPTTNPSQKGTPATLEELQVGDHLPVLYSRSDPSIAAVKKPTSLWLSAIGIFVTGLIISSAGWWIIYKAPTLFSQAPIHFEKKTVGTIREVVPEVGASVPTFLLVVTGESDRGEYLEFRLKFRVQIGDPELIRDRVATWPGRSVELSFDPTDPRKFEVELFPLLSELRNGHPAVSTQA